MKLFFNGWKKWFVGVGSFLGIFAAVVTIVHEMTQSGATAAPGHIVISTALAITAGVGVACIGVVVVVHSIQRFHRLVADSKHLRQLRRSLPILFQKTEHLRDYLSRQNLDEAHDRLQNGIAQLKVRCPNEYDELAKAVTAAQTPSGGLNGSPATIPRISSLVRSILDADPGFSTRGARLILEDLRKSFDDVYPGKETSCMILLAADDPLYEQVDSNSTPRIPLIRSVEKRLPHERTRGEDPYLRNGASLGVHVLSTGQGLHFGRLAEVQKYHCLFDWRDPHDADNGMDKYVESGVLFPIIENGKPTSVLQVDSPYIDAFGPEAAHMVKCAADCLGILFECHNSLTESFCQGIVLRYLCKEYEQTLGAMNEEGAEFSAEFEDQKTRLEKAQEELVDLKNENDQLKRDIADMQSRSGKSKNSR